MFYLQFEGTLRIMKNVVELNIEPIARLFNSIIIRHFGRVRFIKLKPIFFNKKNVYIKATLLLCFLFPFCRKTFIKDYKLSIK